MYLERCSLIAASDGLEASTTVYGDERLVQDARGYNHIILRETRNLLEKNDSRLMVNSLVTSIECSDSGVRVATSGNTFVTANYAACTFSIGLLQHKGIEFEPTLLLRKQLAINSMKMGIYTKIFFQSPKQFCPNNVENLWYAGPVNEGSFAWRSLDCKGFKPGSKILIAAVVGDTAARAHS